MSKRSAGLLTMLILVSMMLVPTVAGAQGLRAGRDNTAEIVQSSEYHTTALGEGSEIYSAIFAQYGIQAVESIPDGIVPFRVETPSELALLMEALTASTTPTSSEVGIGVGGPDSFTSRYCVATNWGTGQMRVYGDFEVSVHRITRLYGVHTNLSGVTLSFSLTNPWGYFTSNVPSPRVSWNGGGTLNAHILVQGLPVIWSQPYSCSGSYTAP